MLMVKLMMNSLGRSTALLESGYIHTRKMVSFLNLYGDWL